ncbi:MAG: primosomal protein N' [Anaerolineales bacterium]|nr:primosomal protein N' [Anaerolineales bacterium]
MFARIIVNVSAISGLFDYAVPPELAAQIQAGCLVAVPFGKQTVQGIIFELTDSPAIETPKPILDLLDPAPLLTPPQLALILQMASATLNPIAAIAALLIPVGLNQQADVLYQLRNVEAPATKEESASLVGKRILNLLNERGPLRGRQIDAHFSKVEWRGTANGLVKKGLLSAKNVLPPPRVRPKYIRVAQLSVTPSAAEAEMEALGTKQTLTRRQAALRFLIKQPEPIALAWVYAASGCNLADLQELEERGLIRLFENEIFRDSLQRLEQKDQELITPELTPEQNLALQKITAALHAQTGDFLLYGVTGSGKTEVYLRAADEALKRGKQALILVPEIALTPQLVRRFMARFPGQVGMAHSKLSEGERYDTWRRARDGKLNVIIGARSALFSPLKNIGLIVVDECHDGSYYQTESPFYNAVTWAQAYAKLCGAVCVLGSATPTVEQRFEFENANQILTLPKRVTDSELPTVEVVDLREELKHGNRGIFSRALAESLAEVLLRKEQAILYINRRGTATYVFCRKCGTTLKCPNCETPLTLHLENSRSATLQCHRCGYTRQKPKTCAHCHSDQIREYGLGSEKVEAELKALFPQARALRWDWDTTRAKDAHEMILTHFMNHQADVLIGTQMLAKGLDLPLVTLVGIVLADVGLNLPDPFAHERVFQTLTQVAGRAGRSARGGKVILQSFTPEDYALQFASAHDVNGFYERELQYRKQLGYPPFMKLARLEYRHAENAQAEEEAKRLAGKLKVKIEAEGRRQTELIGPVPCFFAKENGFYRWQIIVRAPQPVTWLQDLNLKDWRVEVDPLNLL